MFWHISGLVLAAALWAGPAQARNPQPGDRFRIDPGNLAAPYETDSVANVARSVGLAPDALLAAPEGYTVTRFAEGLSHARWMAVAPTGEVFLSEPNAGKVTLLHDRDGDGRAERRSTFLTGLNRPHGLALRDGYLYVADVRRVWRFAWAPGQSRSSGPPLPVTPANALGGTGGHWTRNIAFGGDGKSLYVTVGSRSNIGEEKPPRATIMRFDFDAANGVAGNGRVFASGLRNPVGIAFRPGTHDLYTVVNERDGLGDESPPDYLTRVRDGGFYGWPYALLGPAGAPGWAEKRPDLVARTVPPDLLFRAHSAPLGLVFAAGGDFPAGWLGDAFVALHGSWNAARPRGYMVVRVPFEDGRPTGEYIAFVTGFRVDDAETGRANVLGRPAGLALGADGSLLIADDSAQVIWRVSRKR